LGNRFYVGELVHRGQTFQGKHRLFIDRQTFDACQRILDGKNKRKGGNPELLFSGGLIRCEACGFAMTGERIRRKLLDGGVREHVYYRCVNEYPAENHPRIRWKEEDIERAIVDDFAALRMPENRAAWFRHTVKAAFLDVEDLQRQQKQSLSRRKSELSNMQDRLLNGYLAGAIDQTTFQAKSSELKEEMGRVEESLAGANGYDPDAPERALALFDFSQNLVDLWRGSRSEVQREILECVTLNRTVSDVSLSMTKRKPFDFLAERPSFDFGRGDRT
jgi:hypothetical protein